MSLTRSQARDSMLAMVRDVWVTTAGLSVDDMRWWDTADSEPDSDEWLRVTVRHTTGKNAAIGRSMFDRYGLLTVQLFTKFGQGLSRSDELSTLLQDAMELGETSEGVMLRRVRAVEVGQSNKRWFQVNVIADFEYCEVK